MTFCVHWMKLTFLFFFVPFSGSVPSDRIVASSMSTFPPLALKLVVHSEARRPPVEVANQALMPGSSICGGLLAQSITPRSCRWLRVSSLSNISRKKGCASAAVNNARWCYLDSTTILPQNTSKYVVRTFFVRVCNQIDISNSNYAQVFTGHDLCIVHNCFTLTITFLWWHNRLTTY